MKVRLFQQCQPADQESNPNNTQSDEREEDIGELDEIVCNHPRIA